MSSNPKKMRILIAEDEPEIRELVAFFIEAEFSAEITEAATGKIAKTILESDPNFDIVVSDYNMPDLNGGQLLQFIRTNKLNIKFILLSAANPKTIPELQSVTPDAMVEKPMFTEPLKRAIESFHSTLEAEPTAVPSQSHESYVRVSIDHLFRLGTVPYALSAKLSDNKFVKVIHDEEYFGKEELDRFKHKNITHLYVSTENAKSFFKKQMDAYLEFIKNKGTSTTDLLSAVDSISGVIQDMTAAFGFSEELESVTKVGMELALKSISLSPSLMSLLANLDLKNGSYLAVHSSRLIYLSNHIAKLMGWGSEATSQKMALASLLHDSTLSNPLHARFQTEEELQYAKLEITKTERDDFYDHPKKAADIAKEFKGIPPDVDIIIAQHHENCAGTGFPSKLNHTRIAPLSCAFIVAHDLLCSYESKGEKFKMEDFIKEKEEVYSAGHFKKILLELVLLKLT